MSRITLLTQYGPSHFHSSTNAHCSFMFWNTFGKTRSPSANRHAFTFELQCLLIIIFSVAIQEKASILLSLITSSSILKCLLFFLRLRSLYAVLVHQLILELRPQPRMSRRKVFRMQPCGWLFCTPRGQGNFPPTSLFSSSFFFIFLLIFFFMASTCAFQSFTYLSYLLVVHINLCVLLLNFL